MTYRSRHVLGWTQVLLGLTLLIIVICAGIASTTASEKRDYSHIPLLERAELVTALEASRGAMLGKPGTSAADFFKTYVAAAQADVLLQKYVFEHPEEKGELAARFGIPGTYMADLMWLRNSYDEKFGFVAMRDAAEASGGSQVVQSIQGSVHVSDPTLIPALLRAAIASAIVAMLFFMARVAFIGMLVWPELPKMAVYALMWPVMIWRYPTEVSPMEQVRRLKRWVAWLMAGSLPVMSMGVARAQDKTEPTDEAGTVYVLKPEEVPLAQVNYSLALGMMSAKVAGNGFTVHEGPVDWADVTFTLGDGLSVGIWASRAREGSRGSDEVDFTIAKSWTLEGDASATVGLALFDIQPMGTGKAGDMVSLFASVNGNLGGMSAFAKAEAYLMTESDKGRNGILLSGGVSDSFSLGELSFDQTVSLAYGQGPFGQDDGFVLRYAGAASMPLAERVRLTLLELKAWLPLSGARDRSPTVTVGTSLSYAH